MCVRVCVYVCMCVCVYECMHVCVYVWEEGGVVIMTMRYIQVAGPFSH